MPWKQVTIMSEKLHFVEICSRPNANISELCRQFGISRKTGYKLLKRFAEAGLVGLEDHSRRPLKSPHRTPAEMEIEILSVRKLHPEWGGEKLRAYLAKKGFQNLPAEKTIDRIL